MEAHIQKWGNSLGLRIPAHISRKLHLHSGSSVELIVSGDCIIIQPKKYTLESLTEAITEHNLHKDLLDDQPKGREEW